MFRHVARIITILGGGCAVLIAGEIMLGEKSTPLSHDPELRAMERAPDMASALKEVSFCGGGDCAPVSAVDKPEAAAVAEVEGPEDTHETNDAAAR